MTEPTEREELYAAERHRAFTLDNFLHAIVVVLVLISATVLRIRNELDTATISTVYGAILGYATGLTVQSTRDRGRARGL